MSIADKLGVRSGLLYQKKLIAIPAARAVLVTPREAHVVKNAPINAHTNPDRFVQSTFVGQLINRRKVYSTELRGTLFRNLNLRHEADYGTDLTTQTEAIRALRRTREFVGAILARSREGDRQ